MKELINELPTVTKAPVPDMHVVFDPLKCINDKYFNSYQFLVIIYQFLWHEKFLLLFGLDMTLIFISKNIQRPRKILFLGGGGYTYFESGQISDPVSQAFSNSIQIRFSIEINLNTVPYYQPDHFY